MPHTSNVEWRKILENFRAAYQSLDPAEILVIEVVANALDAGASEISLSTRVTDDATVLSVSDNGHGMRSKEEFDRYHDLGSLSKSRGGTIGWAGIGAKLYLDRCSSVTTETRSKSFGGASIWSFPADGKAPVWEEVTPRGLVPGKTGTTVQVTCSRGVDKLVFATENLIDLVLTNYNYALEPFGRAHLFVNGREVSAFNPAQTASASEEFSVKLRGGGQATGWFYLLREPAPIGFELVSLVVNGKTIGEQFDFKQLARIKDYERVAGYARCDELVTIVTTPKDGFNRKSPIWSEFNKRVGELFSKWLDRNGVLAKLERDADFEDLASAIGKDLNKVFDLPEIRLLGLDLFQLFGARRTAIETPTGSLTGGATAGTQTTTGTVGGSGDGSGVPTEGDEPGPGIRLDPSGDRRVAERSRQTKGGVRIAYGNQPDRLERAWLDPGLRAILVNKAHPAFACADGLGSIPFYTAECCFAIVTEPMEAADQREAAVRKLFEAFVAVAG